MASASVSPLLAILLVTSSSRGAHIAFQYPRRPKVEKRYSRVRYHVEEDEKAKDQYHLQEDEMDDDFEGEVEELTEDEETSDDSDSDSEDLAEVDEGQSDRDGAANRRDADMASNSAAGTNKDNAARDSTAGLQQRMKRLRAYQQYLGYDTEVLASILSPKRELCHRKFELVIDDLAFVGHPVCVNKEGTWDVDLQQNYSNLGKSLNEVAGQTEGYTIGKEEEDEEAEVDRKAAATKQLQPPMTIFHLVLVLDRPDPSPHLPMLDLITWLQIFYDNIALKTTAALYAEEVRSEYVSRECEQLIALRDRCMDDAQSYTNYLTQALNFSSLARLLQQIYTTTSICADTSVTINDVTDVHLHLPSVLHDPKRILGIADVETPLDANDTFHSKQNIKGPSNIEDLIATDWTRTNIPTLFPWKTLLLLSEDEADLKTDLLSHERIDILNSNKDHRLETRTKQLCQLLEPRLSGIPSLAEIANLLGWNLEDEVYPIARDLIHNRLARVVDVPRIQNYYAISPLFELADLAHLSISWSMRFPILPPLASFLARLSSSLTQFGTLCRKDQREICMDALIWLLRHQIVVQMHVRLRLIAVESAKRRAAELRNVERAKKEEQRRRRRTVETGLRTLQNNIVVKLVSSAPAATSIAESSQRERGRSQERVMTSTSQEKKEGNKVVNMSLTPSFSATRPEHTQQPGQAASTISAARGVVSVGSKVPADRGDELRFEKRPVLKSQSPSRVLAVAGDKKSGAGLRGLASSSSSSQPTVPRGRGREVGQLHESSGADPLFNVEQQGEGQSRVQSVPAVAANQQVIQRQHRSVTREDHHKGAASRSPSRARMRVTGFGEGEEVHVDSESGSFTSSKSNEARAGVSISSLRTAADIEAIRRLSLVGEDVEAEDASPVHITPGGDDNVQIHDEFEQEDIEVESWETNPVATLIAEPSRASGKENKWIAAMIEMKPALLAQRLQELLPFLNGKHTIDEIVYRLNWRRKDLRAILVEFKEEILTLVHP